MRFALLVATAAVLNAQTPDLAIVRKAEELLSGEAVWNRHDTRECPAASDPSACIARWKRPWWIPGASSSTGPR